MLLKNVCLIFTPSITYKITPAGHSTPVSQGCRRVGPALYLAYGLIIPNIRGMVRVRSYSLLVLSSQ